MPMRVTQYNQQIVHNTDTTLQTQTQPYSPANTFSQVEQC